MRSNYRSHLKEPHELFEFDEIANCARKRLLDRQKFVRDDLDKELSLNNFYDMHGEMVRKNFYLCKPDKAVKTQYRAYDYVN